MTLARRLALAISSRVVRWASPGCKEWAEGLEREARIIESDWGALRWAIGSTRVLLDRRPAPLTSLDEVPAQMQKLVEMTRTRAGFVSAMSIVQGLRGLLYLWWFFHVRSTLECTGCTIAVLGSILMAAYSLTERRRLNAPWKDHIYDDLLACTHFYKEQLKRFDNLWIYLLFSPCWMLGDWLYGRNSYDPEDVIFLGVFVVMFLFLMRQRKLNNLRRIDEIDALMAERDGVHSL